MAISPGPYSWRARSPCRRTRGEFEADATASESRRLYAVNTGMRKSEILGLRWERIDLSTSRITLYETKSGKPRGVPLNSAVYDTLVALQPAAERRVGLVFRRSAERAGGRSERPL
jgi:integrase